MTVDAAGLEPGAYAADVALVTDAGRQPVVTVPVRLEVVPHADDQHRVNVGGRGYTDVGGDRWAADRRYRGDYGHEPPSQPVRTRQPVDGTDDDTLYQQARIGDGFAYRFGRLEDGRYEVELHFAEIEPREAGERRFDVVANGVTLLAGYDITADVGDRTAVVHRFTLDVTGGGVRIWFLSRHDSAPALVSAVQLTRVGGLPGAAPSGPPWAPW